MTTKLRDELRLWVSQPPYSGVIWLAWLYVVAASFLAGGGPFAGDLIWFDDRVRLVQIFDWLNGQGWYDRTIMRVNAPEGFHTIWSRVVDLPAAGIIAALQGCVGQMHAGMIAAIFLPLMQVLLLFYAARYFARPLVGRKHAPLVTLFVLFTSAINPESFTLAGFQVGMLSHHSWYVLLTLMLFGALGRLVLLSDARQVVIGGLAIAGLLTVGIEGLPLIAGACCLVAIVSWRHNRPRLTYDALRLTALGALCGFALLPANQPPDKLLSISFAEPSILGPILVSAAALFFAGQLLVLRLCGDNRNASLTLTAIIAAVIAAFLIHIFPQLLEGGAAALSPEERMLAASEHVEAMPIFRLAINKVDYLRMIMPPLLAAAYALYRMSRTPTPRRRAVLIFYLGLVALAFGMASTFSRYFHYLGLAVSPWLLSLWLASQRPLAHDDYRALKSFVLFVALGPLWLWLVPAANYNHNFGSSVLLFPAKILTEPKPCDAARITDFLNARYTADKTIIVPMYGSDRFLLHTNLHIFFLANFPSHNKFIPARLFYDTAFPDQARQIAAENNFDLVAVCTKAYTATTQSALTNQLLRGRMSFGQALSAGQVPDWLRPVEIAASTPWLLFEVDKGKLSPPAP